MSSRITVLTKVRNGDKRLISHQNGSYIFCEFEKFIELPNLETSDILEYFVYQILQILTEFTPRREADELIFTDFGNVHFREYVDAIGRLFLDDLIDFGIEGGDPKNIECSSNLSKFGKNKFETWVYFRDNFFLNENYFIDPDRGVEIYNDASWEDCKNWSGANVWACATQKGVEYFKDFGRYIVRKYADKFVS